MSAGFGSPLFVLGLAAVPATPPAQAGFFSPVFVLGLASTPVVTPPFTPGDDYVNNFRRHHGE